MKVKICGITNKSDAFAAVDFGADAVGFILFSGSRRHIEPACALEIARQLPPFVQRVAVTVNMPVEELRELDATRVFDLWQLHGEESPAHCELLQPRRLIKALGLPLAGGVNPSAYAAEAFLLDTADPARGGTGRIFDWSLALDFKSRTPKPCILSGGLNPDNVGDAIRVVQPFAVDVSSGVEQSPGVKDHKKMKEFIGLCHRP